MANDTTQTITISKSNEVGFPDVYEADISDTPLKIKAIYEGGGQFSVDLIFTASPSATIQLTSFTSTLNSANVTQSGSNALTLSGSAINIFTDAYYQFIMPDKTLKILKADTTEQYLSLIKWEPPSTKMTTVTHSITYLVTPVSSVIDIPYTATSTFTQDIFWQWRTAIAQFRTVLSKGTI